MIEAVLLAVALAVDATAVAAGRAVTGMPRRSVMVLAMSFGVFQAGMAAIGWVLGESAKSLVDRWDHWIAFALLMVIGGKMLVEAARPPTEGAEGPSAELGLRTLFVLSIATSIDALAAGVTLPLLEVSPAIALALIGLASLVLSMLGGTAGAALGARFGRRLEVLGGLTLIAIGVKTLVAHLGSQAG